MDAKELSAGTREALLALDPTFVSAWGSMVARLAAATLEVDRRMAQLQLAAGGEQQVPTDGLSDEPFIVDG